MHLPYTTTSLLHEERERAIEALRLERTAREARRAHGEDSKPSPIGRLVLALRPAR